MTNQKEVTDKMEQFFRSQIKKSTKVAKEPPKGELAKPKPEALKPKPEAAKPKIEPKKPEKAIIMYHTKWIKKTFPELDTLGVRVLKYIYTFESPFPRTVWSIANFLEASEPSVQEQCENLANNPQYKIRKVAWNNGVAYEQI